jgi:MYXO-CTERM domain-containing protein
MNTSKWALGVAIAATFSTANAAGRDDFSISHFEPLQRLEVRGFGAQAANAMQQPGAESTVMSFDALGRSFNLELEHNSRFMTAARRNPALDGVQIYRGEIAGADASWVRIVMVNGVPSGMFFDGQEFYAIEAPGDSAVATDVPVVYRLADTYVTPGAMSCGSADPATSAATAVESLLGELHTAAEAQGAVSEIELGVVGDFEFTQNRGGDAAAAQAITTRLNNVDGIFSSQVGIQISVQAIETFNTNNDPFTTSDAEALLNELSDYRLNNPVQNSNGLTHLWTGRDLDGTTVGIAWTGALCSARFGAGLSEGNAGPGFDSLVAAHEIGHNFGAPHDGEAESACEAQTGDWLMSPRLSNIDQFSPCSLEQMADDIADASDNRFGNACIAPLPSIDMTVGLQSSATVLFGAESNLSYEVVNNGSLEATNVAVDVAIPSNLTVGAATAASGACDIGTGTVNCTLGDIPGFGLRTVDITVTPNALGAGVASATVSADADDRPGNNQESLQLTVDPAVDLVVNPPAGSTVRVGKSTTITATLQNRATIGATGVTLTIDIGSSLDPSSASWPLGSCAVQGQRVTCQAATFAAQSNSTVSLTVNGVTEGSPRVTLSLASAEPDLEPGDNSGVGRFEVTESSESGGSTGPLFLLLLGAVAALRRRL